MNIFVRRTYKEFHYADNEIFLTDTYLDLNNKYFKNVPIGFAEYIEDLNNKYIDFESLDKFDSANEINIKFEGKLMTLYDVNRTLGSIYNIVKYFNYNIKQDKYILVNDNDVTLQYDCSLQPKSFFKPSDKETNLYFDYIHNFYKNKTQHQSLTIQNNLNTISLDRHTMRIHNAKNSISTEDIPKYMTIQCTHDYSKRQIITFGKKKRRKWIQLNSNGVTIFSDIEGKDKTHYVVGTNFHPNDICWNGSIFVIVGMNKYSSNENVESSDNGSVYWSHNGESWTVSEYVGSGNYIDKTLHRFTGYIGNNINWNGTYFMVVGIDLLSLRSSLFYSLDGKKWDYYYLEDYNINIMLRSIYSNGQQSIVSGNNFNYPLIDSEIKTNIYYSSDRINWSLSTIQENYNKLSFLYDEDYDDFGITFLNGIIYLIGNNRFGNTDKNVINRYYPNTNKWYNEINFDTEYTTSMPNVKYNSIKCVNIGKKIIIFKTGSNEYILDNYVYEYLPDNTTKNIYFFTKAGKHNRYGVIGLNGEIFIVGGMNDILIEITTSQYEYQPTEYVYTCSTQTYNFQYKNSMNTSRSDPGLAVLNGQIYAIGGKERYTNPNGYNSVYGSRQTYTVERYPSSDGGWEYVSSLHVPRSRIGVAVLNGEIYAIGGIDSNQNPLSSVERYYYNKDSDSMVWKEVSPLLVIRNKPGVAVLNGKIYVIGGFDNNNNFIKSMEWYEPISDKWYSYVETIQTGACWNGNNFVMVGDKYTLTSIDGTKWDTLTDEYNFTDIIWNGNIHVAIGKRIPKTILPNNDDLEQIIIWWSYDGKNWSKWNLISPVFPLDKFTEKKVKCVEWNGEMFSGQLFFKFKFGSNTPISYVNTTVHSINGKDWTIKYQPVILNEFTHNQHIQVNDEPVIFRDSGNEYNYKQGENVTIYFYSHEKIGIGINAMNIHNNDIFILTYSNDGITYTNNIQITNANVNNYTIFYKFLKFTFTSQNNTPSSGWELILFPETIFTLYNPLKLNTNEDVDKYVFVDRPIKFFDDQIQANNGIKKYKITFYSNCNIKITVNNFYFINNSDGILYNYLSIQDRNNNESLGNITDNSWLRKGLSADDINNMYGLYFPNSNEIATSISNVTFPHTFITKNYVQFIFHSNENNDHKGWNIDISPLHYTTSLISNSLYENQIIFEPSKMMILGTFDYNTNTPNGRSFISQQRTYNWNSNHVLIHCNDICWNGYRFVCVGQTISSFYPDVNSIIYSDDGYNWLNPIQISDTFIGRSICWNGQLFVAVGENTEAEGTRIFYSYDGNIWDAVSFGGTEYFGNAIHVIWNGEKFLTTVKKDDVYSICLSFDGVTWNYHSNNYPSIGKLCWDGTKYVSIAVIDSDSTTVIHHSSDGISWKTVPDATIPNFKGNSVCWNGEIFILVGNDTNATNNENYPIYYSENGTTWNKATNILNYLFVGNDVCWNGQYFVAVGKLSSNIIIQPGPPQLHLIYWSHNGKDWNVDYTSSEMDAEFISNESQYSLNAICWTGNTVNLSSQGEFNGKVKLNQTSSSSSPQLSIQSNTDLEFVTDSYDNNTDKSNQIIIDVHY